MSTLISIDPGLHGLGCGYFANGELIAGWYAAPPDSISYGTRGPARWRAVIKYGLEDVIGVHNPPDFMILETMQIYDQRSWKGDPADVLEVQGVAGAIAGWCPSSTEMVGYLPRAWKSTVPQDVYAARVEAYLEKRGWLDRLEKCPKKRRHDMMHGIGIGLHHLGMIVAGRTVA